MALAVVDASVIIAWLFEETAPDSESLLGRIVTQGAIVPNIWSLEMANMMVKSVRRGVSERKVQAAIASLWDLPIEIDKRTAELAWSRILALAIRHELSAYDAAYLELALRHASVLMTFDRKLANAARKEGVLVMPA